MGVSRPHDAARRSKLTAANALKCRAFRDGTKRKRWRRNELLTGSRSRRIPRSRFGFPLICHAFELVDRGKA